MYIICKSISMLVRKLKLIYAEWHADFLVNIKNMVYRIERGTHQYAVSWRISSRNGCLAVVGLGGKYCMLIWDRYRSVFLNFVWRIFRVASALRYDVCETKALSNARGDRKPAVNITTPHILWWIHIYVHTYTIWWMRAYFGTVHALVIYIYASLVLALHHPSIHLCWFHLKERCCAHVRLCHSTALACVCA